MNMTSVLSIVQTAQKVSPVVVVVGLGYVGLPLAVALADHFETWGLDIDITRVAELRQGIDRTLEVEKQKLLSSRLKLASAITDCPRADIFVMTLPTPVDAECRPDLRLVLAATRAVAARLEPGRGTIVVYESTVYPGVTEDICGPELERHSGLKRGTDFFLGYSPERINPGDRKHSIDRILKVVAGETPEVTERLAALYGQVTTGGVFRAASIKVAEAAKVIENAQRDINIAFINEISVIFARLGLSVWDVLEAAGTKWNFLKFEPGLVGGHCIGVDPYYLSFRAEQLGYQPKVILAGRGINEGMARWLADELHARRYAKPGRALVLGITFKENVPDLRNSKVIDLIRRLKELGHQVTVHDPHADRDEAREQYGVCLDAGALSGHYDLVIGAVPHADYREMPPAALDRLVAPGGLLADLKGMWRKIATAPTLERWSL